MSRSASDVVEIPMISGRPASTADDDCRGAWRRTRALRRRAARPRPPSESRPASRGRRRPATTARTSLCARCAAAAVRRAARSLEHEPLERRREARAERGRQLEPLELELAAVIDGARRGTALASSARNVTVAVARTATGLGQPESASRPLGTSSASTGTRAALIASIATRNSSLTGRSRPVPSSASTTTSALRELARLERRRTRRRRRGSRRRLALPPPLNRSAGATSNTCTVRPAACARRATTRPSPALLPAPQTIASERAFGQRRVDRAQRAGGSAAHQLVARSRRTSRSPTARARAPARQLNTASGRRSARALMAGDYTERSPPTTSSCPT